MSKRSRPRPERREARPRAAAAPSAALRPVVLAAALAVLATLAWWLLRPHGASPEDPLATLDAPAAFAEGARLGAAGRHVESVPYFRRAAAVGGTWESHFNLASALGNAALQVRTRAGREEPAMRSSAERMAMVFEAYRESERALALAREPRQKAMTLFATAQREWTWGLVRDAVEHARAAREADPAWDVPARFLAQAERDLAAGGSEAP